MIVYHVIFAECLALGVCECQSMLLFYTYFWKNQVFFGIIHILLTILLLFDGFGLLKNERLESVCRSLHFWHTVSSDFIKLRG